MRNIWEPHLRPALKAAEELLPASGEVADLLENLSLNRGRPLTLLTEDLGSARSGLLISTEAADYIVVSSSTSPERTAAIVCHEVAHALLGHAHTADLADSLMDSGLVTGLDEDLVRSVVAARDTYEKGSESDAELLGTHLSFLLRERVLRGGHTFFDERWQ